MVISPATVGARFLDFCMVELGDGGGAAPHALAETEQVLFVRAGGIDGLVNGERFRATAGEWVFVPENAKPSLQAGGAPCSLIAIRAHDAAP